MQEREPLRIASSVVVQMAFACENISTDPTGRVSFVNIIEELWAGAFPASTASFFAIFGFYRPLGGNMLQCKVEILPQNGNPMVTQDVRDIAFLPDRPYHRVVSGFPGITWPAAGDYLGRFVSRGETLAYFPIRVRLASPATAPPKI